MSDETTAGEIPVTISDTPVVDPGRRNWFEVVATVLLALAAVATAWSSYQATRWNGEASKASGRTNTLRIGAARAQGLSETQTQVDIATYIAWVDATVDEKPELAEFYDERFRAEFRPAFDAWLATQPFTNATAPPTPFAMEEYRLAAADEAERLDAEAEVSAANVGRNLQHAANYVLGVVLFAVALFFGGMSGRLNSRWARRATLIMGCVVLIGAAAWIATFPVSLAV